MGISIRKVVIFRELSELFHWQTLLTRRQEWSEACIGKSKGFYWEDQRQLIGL